IPSPKGRGFTAHFDNEQDIIVYLELFYNLTLLPLNFMRRLAAGFCHVLSNQDGDACVNRSHRFV
ncbi:hypothetical protein, partial [Mitsuokella multacida]